MDIKRLQRKPRIALRPLNSVYTIHYPKELQILRSVWILAQIISSPNSVEIVLAVSVLHGEWSANAVRSHFSLISALTELTAP